MTEFPYPVADPLDAEAATGPPWPRLVAASPDYRTPRLIKWPIVVGLLLYVAYIAAVFAMVLATSHHASTGGTWEPGYAATVPAPFDGT